MQSHLVIKTHKFKLHVMTSLAGRLGKPSYLLFIVDFRFVEIEID